MFSFLVELKQCEVVKVWSIIQNGGAEYKINDVGKSVSEVNILSKVISLQHCI